jgi:hypothetical protein
MKFLFFSPHSIPWKHSFPEAIVADELRKSGNEIIYVSCGGLLGNYCIPKIGKFLDEKFNEKKINSYQKVCDECKHTDKFIRKNFSFNGDSLIDLITQNDKNEINSLISKIDLNKVFEHKYQGINIGKIAFYQIILRFKLNQLVVGPNLKERYLEELRDTYYAAFAIQKLLKKNNIDRIIVYNSLYSVNKIVLEIAKKLKITTYTLHAGQNLSERLQTLVISKNDVYQFNKNLIQNWDKYSGYRITQEQYKKVTDHFRHLLTAKSIFTYSIKRQNKEKNIREYFLIPQKSKILVATMASNDEELAAEFNGSKDQTNNEIFTTQIDWIENLIKFLGKRNDLFLIIRPHPREFANKRENIKSEHSNQILKLVASGLPLNVRFNLPTDEISIYDYIDQADVFLNSWSNVGKEIAIFGKPVVIYSTKNIYYHPSLNYVGFSKSDYFKKIENAIIDGWNFKWVINAYRWYVYEQQIATIPLHKVCKLKEENNLSYLKLVYQKIIIKIFPEFYYKNQMKHLRKNKLDIKETEKMIHDNKITLLDVKINQIKKENSIDKKIIDKEYLNLVKLLYPNKRKLNNSLIFKNYTKYLNSIQ